MTQQDLDAAAPWLVWYSFASRRALSRTMSASACVSSNSLCTHSGQGTCTQAGMQASLPSEGHSRGPCPPRTFNLATRCLITAACRCACAVTSSTLRSTVSILTRCFSALDHSSITNSRRSWSKHTTPATNASHEDACHPSCTNRAPPHSATQGQATDGWVARTTVRSVVTCSSAVSALTAAIRRITSRSARTASSLRSNTRRRRWSARSSSVCVSPSHAHTLTSDAMCPPSLHGGSGLQQTATQRATASLTIVVRSR